MNKPVVETNKGMNVTNEELSIGFIKKMQNSEINDIRIFPE